MVSLDVQVGSYKFRVDRTAEGGGFQQYHIRDENEQARAGSGLNTSRLDTGVFHQTNWSGGSAWWQPAIDGSSADLYYTAKNMNVWERPGKLMPGNDVELITATGLLADSPLVAGLGEYAAIGSTSTVNAAYYDAFEYDATSNAWELASTARTTGVDKTHSIYAMCYDPNDDYYYVAANNFIHRFKTSSATFDNQWLAVTTRNGCNLFVHNGSLFYYDGDVLYSVTKAGPTLVTITDDGQGVDLLGSIATGTGPVDTPSTPLALGTPEGVYYVKNVIERGSCTPYVYRVERDAAGNWTGYAIAVLPSNTIALNITTHLGNVLVATSNDVGKVLANIKTSLYKVLIYEISGSNYQVLGSPLGGESPDETPFSFLGSDGTILFIGGQQRLWAYDGARGGLHPAHEYTTAGDFIPLSLVVTDSKVMWNRYGTVLAVQTLDSLNNLGNGAGTQLESGFFDFGLPFEQKRLTGIRIIGEDMTSYDTFTVSVSVDGAAYVSVLVYTSADGFQDSTDYTAMVAGSNPAAGYRFRYKVVYTSSATSGQPTKRPKVAGLMFEAAVGELRKAWRIVVDGTAITNIENQPARAEVVFDNLETIAATNIPQTFIHNLGEYDGPAETTRYVKLMNVEIRKMSSGEIESGVLTLVEV